MTAKAAPRSIDHGHWSAALLPQAAWLLAVAVALEFLLLRNLSRTALHIPDLEGARAVYTVGSDLGRYAYFVALASLAATLGLVSVRTWLQRNALGAAALFAILAYAGALILTPGTAVPIVVTDALSLGAVFVAAAVAVAANRRLFPLALLAAIAFAASTTWNASQAFTPTDGTPFRWITELATIGAAFAVPLALRARIDRVALAAGGTAGFLAFGYFLGNPATAGILLLWNGGLAGILPGAVYAVAIAIVAATLTGLARSGERSYVPALILMVCAGVTLQNTYQTGLLVGAFVLFALLPTIAGDSRRALETDPAAG